MMETAIVFELEATEVPSNGVLSEAGSRRIVPFTGTFLHGFDGTIWRALSVDATGRMQIDVASLSGNVTVVQATASSLNAQVVGDVANDGIDAGNPVKIGGQARTTNPTAVADGDRVNMYMDDLGKPVVYPYAPRDRIVHNRLALTSATETTLIAAGAAGVFRDIVGFVVSNESATETRIDFRDSTAGTIRLSIDMAADGGGAVIFPPVPMTQATAANNWTAQLSGAVSTVYVTAWAVENN